MASGDTALWLHNKLGSTDDLWSGRTICAQLSRERLQNIQACFHSLQPHVKVKLLLSFLHVHRRNVDEWRTDMEEVLLMALNDTDQWVSTVAEILHTYPTSGTLTMELEDNKTFSEVLADLKKFVKKTDTQMLPMECQFLNRNALISVAGTQPQPIKHFALKRKPKSAALRVELLQKSSEYASNKKSSMPHSLPLKVRSFAKKLDDTTPYRGIPNRTPPSSGFRSPSALGRYNSNPATGARGGPIRKGVGIKLLDITEQPVGAKEAKRRRKQAEIEATEQLKKDKESAVISPPVAVTMASFTPDYAAGLITPSSTVTPVSTNAVTLTNPGPTYIPNSTSHLAVTGGSTTLPSTVLSAVTQQARDNLHQQLQQQLGQSTIRAPSSISTVVALGQPTVINPSVISQPPQQQQQQPAVQQPSLQIPSVPTPSPTPTPANNPKKGLSLTREQMLEAQEMFRTSNKVTRPEKALILGFMAGSRENPCPQQGDVLSIRLSENMEMLPQKDNTQKKVIVDSFFQMNYATGEWKRIKKYREISS